MSQHVTDQERFRFKLSDIALREEIHLTERQRFLVRRLFESDWKHAYIDVLPTTIMVPKDTAESKLAIKRAVIISGDNPETLHVYAAPEFRIDKPCKTEFIDWKLYWKPFVNIAKVDLKVVTVFDSAPPMSVEAERRTCFVCRAPHNEHKERRLFALACGHWACRACWRTHCEWYLVRGMSPIPCRNGDCSEKLTIRRAAVLLCDEAVNMIIAYEWRDKLRMKDTLRCVGCRHWMQRNNFYSKAKNAVCTCGCYTCLDCGQLDHTPLRCKDAAVWSGIRAIANEEESAEAADKMWGLTRENFEECLWPSKAIASDLFTRNLRFMRTNDRTHGKMLEKSMPMAARMLERRLVMQLANRKELQPRADDVCGADRNQRWAYLEKYFTLALDTLEETRHKAAYLNTSRDHVLSYYEL